jgi:CRP-like cAMP-binding protein
MVSQSEKATILLQHDFFRDMPSSSITRLTAHARLLSFPRAARIFSKGDASDGLMAVLSGLVRISVPSEGTSELTLNLIGPGGVFGEIALLDGEPRTADAIAMQPCRLLLLERRDFLATLLEEPAAALTLLKILSGRLRRTSQQLEQARFAPVSQRLAQALLTLENASGSGGSNATVIKMPQRQIGNMIGLSRESTNRYLRDWQRAGVIALHQGTVTICDRKTLTGLADGDPPP